MSPTHRIAAIAGRACTAIAHIADAIALLDPVTGHIMTILAARLRDLVLEQLQLYHRDQTPP